MSPAIPHRNHTFYSNTSTIILDTLSIEGGGWLMFRAWVESRKIIIFKFNKYTAYYLNLQHVCKSEKLRRPYNYDISMRIISILTTGFMDSKITKL